ncbi:MAG: peptidoglycan -binding protein [Proteobacteria bacterium]|nr:peptidoglycan -binding protein [Pseudomonadota bacterium]
MRTGSRQRGGRGSGEHWPGFVDALSSLLLVIIFLLSMFVLAQFFLGQALNGRDAELVELNETIAELTQTLAMEREETATLRLNLLQLSASLQSSNMTREELEDRVGELKSLLASAQAQAATNAEQRNVIAGLEASAAAMQQSLVGEQQRSKAARDEVALLNQQLAALRQQLARLEAALIASEKRDEDQQAVIADLGKRLNVALAQRVQDLAAYRSEFFGKLRQALANVPGIRIVGDRFVVQSEVLFPSGSADLNPAGKQELTKLANTLITIMDRIPADVDWVLRVDGHTDPVPINTPLYPSNWELSTARATSVVRQLVSAGIPPNRLAATGFGEFQPIDPGAGPEANRRNRRIEFKLTQR